MKVKKPWKPFLVPVDEIDVFEFRRHKWCSCRWKKFIFGVAVAKERRPSILHRPSGFPICYFLPRNNLRWTSQYFRLVWRKAYVTVIISLRIRGYLFAYSWLFIYVFTDIYIFVYWQSVSQTNAWRLYGMNTKNFSHTPAKRSSPLLCHCHPKNKLFSPETFKKEGWLVWSHPSVIVVSCKDYLASIFLPFWM